MEIEIGDRSVSHLRVCDECEGVYSKSIEPNQEEWEDILRKAELGLLIITESADDIDVRESYFVCADCNNSTHIDDTSGEDLRKPEDDEIIFPHPFFKADFTKPK